MSRFSLFELALKERGSAGAKKYEYLLKKAYIIIIHILSSTSHAGVEAQISAP